MNSSNIIVYIEYNKTVRYPYLVDVFSEIFSEDLNKAIRLSTKLVEEGVLNIKTDSLESAIAIKEAIKYKNIINDIELKVSIKTNDKEWAIFLNFAGLKHIHFLVKKPIFEIFANVNLGFLISYVVMLVYVVLTFMVHQEDYTFLGAPLYSLSKYLWDYSLVTKLPSIFLFVIEFFMIFFSVIYIMAEGVFNNDFLRFIIWVLSISILSIAFGKMEYEESKVKRKKMAMGVFAKELDSIYSEWTPPVEFRESNFSINRYINGIAPNDIFLRLRYAQYCLYKTKLPNKIEIIYLIDFLYEEKQHNYGASFISTINSLLYMLFAQIILLNGLEVTKNQNINSLISIAKKNKLLVLSKAYNRIIIWYNSPYLKKDNAIVLKSTSKQKAMDVFAVLVYLVEMLFSHEKSGFARPAMFEVQFINER